MLRPRLLGFTFAALLSVAVGAAGVAVAPEARAAEPSAADAETALKLFKDGIALRDKGDIPGAVTKFRAAYALAETPITALELGRTYAMLGKVIEARGVLLTVARIPVRKNESPKSTDARKDAATLATDMEPRLASLKVRVKGAPPDRPAKITVDGVPVPPEAAAEPRVVNPGRHTVIVEVDGRTKQGEIAVEEGKSGEIELEVPAGAAEAPPPPPPPPPPGAERPSSGRSPLVYVGFGTAVAGLAVGSVAGILTMSKASALKDVCKNDRCPPSAQSDLDASSTTGTIATVGFVVAGVGVGVGVAGLLLSSKSEPKTEAAPASTPSARLFLTPTGALVRGTF